MAGFRIEGNTSGNVAEVDVTNNLKVNLPTAIAQAGYAGLVGINDDGTVVAGGRRNRVYVSENNALTVTERHVWWDDTFNATAQNTAKYRAPATTQTVTFVAGYAILNGGSVTTINTNSALQTYKVFPLFSKSELRINFSALHTVAPQVSAVTEWGAFNATLPGAAAPSDGVFFRFNAAAELRGVISYNGTETQTAAIAAPSANVNHDYLIIIQTNTVLFFIDDIMVGKIILATDAPGLGQPTSAATFPLTWRHYIGGSAPALAMQFRVSDVFVTMLGSEPNRPWSHVKAGYGHMAYQGQNGGTMGTAAQYANNTNPAAAVPTNTTAALGTGLGGKFQETLTLAAGTDGILCSFQNPAGTVTQTPRNLVITGITISGVVTVALTTSPLSGTLALCFGHTALSLATTETATAKAPRRIAIGTTSLASATSAPGVPVLGPAPIGFDSPVVVAPGEFVAVSHNKVTTAPATGAVMWSITIDGYFE
jgi:hypothetical protein